MAFHRPAAYGIIPDPNDPFTCRTVPAQVYPMTSDPIDTDLPRPALRAYLLHRIEFGRCLALQQRVARNMATQLDGNISLLLCEHPNVITVGRDGSAAGMHFDAGLLRSRQIEVHWVKRGGGCMLHTPGQLAVYPIVPLRWHGLSVGQFLDRFQSGLLAALVDLGLHPELATDGRGIMGRTGRIVSLGIAVRDWITSHGAFVNVNPSMGLFRLLESSRDEASRMGCLVAERQQPVKMTSVRTELIRQLATAFGCDRYHLHTGHPLLR